MKFLLLSLNYYPELIGIGKYNHEMVDWLLKRKYQVRVITTYPYYPKWELINFGLRNLWYSCNKNKTNNLTIIRCPIYVPKNPTGFNRILHHVSFAISVLPVMLFHILWRPKIIFLTEPPFLCSLIVLLVGLISKSKTILHIHDFEIDAAFNLSLIKGEIFKKFLLFFEKIIMNSFGIVSTISSEMQNKLLNKGISSAKIKLLKNWCDLDKINPKAKSKNSQMKIKRKFNIPTNNLIALYSGNMSNKQGLEILGKLVSKCTNLNVFFIFCGEGPKKKELQHMCAKFKNVKFLPLQSNEKFIELLTLCDIHLLPQVSNVSGIFLPSKLSGMMASGNPIICSASKNSELSQIVKNCGYVADPNNFGLFYKYFLKLLKSKDIRLRFGKNGRIYSEKYFNKKNILEKFFVNLQFK